MGREYIFWANVCQCSAVLGLFTISRAVAFPFKPTRMSSGGADESLRYLVGGERDFTRWRSLISEKLRFGIVSRFVVGCVDECFVFFHSS